MSDRLLILDADGVFLDERPYWNAALATALIESGRSFASADAWDALADAAFGDAGLQRAAKRRGCNSNHDLAAVLARALDDPSAAAAFDAMLAAGRLSRAAAVLDAACAALGVSADAPARDPLASFGIDRGGEFFSRIVLRFQRVLRDAEPGLSWSFEREALRQTVDETVAVLDAARRGGWTLRVCTGRPRGEIDPPIRRLGLGAWLAPACVTSADEVHRGESARPGQSLGKPHPFPVWCALAGFEAALAWLDGRPAAAAPVAVYVGDSLADALAVRRARAPGLEVSYVHVRSDAADDALLDDIERDRGTVGVVDTLSGLLPLIGAGLVP